MIILTSLCGGDGNALKHDGIRREDPNASPAALINTPPSAENPKLEAGMPSQGRPLIYSSACVCSITAAAGNISAEQIIPLFFASLPIIPSSCFSSLHFLSGTRRGSPLISSSFVLFLLAVSFACCSPPPPHRCSFVHACSL